MATLLTFWIRFLIHNVLNLERYVPKQLTRYECQDAVNARRAYLIGSNEARPHVSELLHVQGSVKAQPVVPLVARRGNDQRAVGQLGGNHDVLQRHEHVVEAAGVRPRTKLRT